VLKGHGVGGITAVRTFPYPVTEDVGALPGGHELLFVVEHNRYAQLPRAAYARDRRG